MGRHPDQSYRPEEKLLFDPTSFKNNTSRDTGVSQPPKVRVLLWADE